MKKKNTLKILQENIKTWNNIASEFDLTRKNNWPELLSLSNYTKDGDKVLDLGCGNGRFFELFKNKKIEYSGIDSSKELIKIALSQLASLKNTQARFMVGNALDLPFKDNSFDVIYSIAVLHHIPSQKLQLQFLEEARRVLKKDGKIVLTVWNLWQRKYLLSLVKYSLLKLIGKSKLDFGDLYIPWQNKYQRYHHAFRKNELKNLFKDAGFKIEKVVYLKRRNIKTNILIIVKERTDDNFDKKKNICKI